MTNIARFIFSVGDMSHYTCGLQLMLSKTNRCGDLETV